MKGVTAETFLVQIGNQRDEVYGAINTPIYLSTTYRHEELGVSRGYDYSRTKNPTRHVLEKALAHLEKGVAAFACSSGMSAIQFVFSLFEKGDHFIVSRDLYGGSYRLFQILSEKYGFTFSYWEGVDFERLESLIGKDTKGIYIETPTNPLMKETDLRRTAKIGKRYNLLLIVDNTFYTPFLQVPIEQGADLVIHSATKYLGGHNDLLAGVVVAKDEPLAEKLRYLHNASGSVLSPFDSWLLIRGLKTLPLRMRQHEKNAKQIRQYLQSAPFVTEVLYPGRGGMISFRIQDEKMVSPFLTSLQLFTFAESLGGVESLITYPATQTHQDIPEEVRKKYGLCNRLLRLSVGLEDGDDLVSDLKQAFETMAQASRI